MVVKPRYSFREAEGRKEQLLQDAMTFPTSLTRISARSMIENTRLGQIARILSAGYSKEDLPAAYQMVMSRNPEHMERSLNELKDLFFMRITPEAADKAIKKISSLERWEI